MSDHKIDGANNTSDSLENACGAGHKGSQHNKGSFKNDPQRASEAGKNGGEHTNDGSLKTDE